MQTEAAYAGSDGAVSDPDAQIFRSEALAYYNGGRRSQGDLLRLSPAWTHYTYWLLVAVFVFAMLGAAVGTVDQYISGPAVVLMELSDAGRNRQTPTIIALLPGHVRPLLQPGMELRLTLTGYPQAAQSLSIDAIEEQILGPAEVRRHLGPALADTIPVAAPVALIRAHPPDPTFVADGRLLDYYSGMQGAAEVRVHSERILFLIVPALRAWLGKQ
jgi:hypothetical protein